jgi:methylated-DNA-[protein]-cysteine S-methyltransferase
VQNPRMPTHAAKAVDCYHYAAVMPAPFGRMGIVTQAEYVQQIVFLPPDHVLVSPENALSAKSVAQLERYLADPDVPFALPLAACGSPFRKRIWAAIAAIPRGETRTYGNLANAANSAARAVGQACGDNPFPLIVPCHRVVAATGIGGFAHDDGGFLINAKRWLLRHEGVLAK